MLTKRIIVCLDMRNGRVVKGVRFEELRDVGDPVELAQRYEQEGADEIVFLDVSASMENRGALLDVVERTAARLFIPLTVGGGVATADDVGAALRAGADKVSVNTAAVKDPELLRYAAERYGRQCIVLSIDAREERRQIEIDARPEVESSHAVGPPPVHNWFRVFTHGGATPTPLDAITWARRGVELGAGEVLLTSIDRDGRRDGYDLELTARVSEAVHVPVIASGGAGTADHMRDVFLLAGADAALAAGIFHDGTTTVRAVKRRLADEGIPVRQEAGPLLT